MLPAHNHVLLRANPPKKISDGGVILTKEEEDKTAWIVAVGPDAFAGWNNPPQVGDRVLHFGAVVVQDNGPSEKYYLTEDNKIALIVVE